MNTRDFGNIGQMSPRVTHAKMSVLQTANEKENVWFNWDYESCSQIEIKWKLLKLKLTWNWRSSKYRRHAACLFLCACVGRFVAGLLSTVVINFYEFSHKINPINAVINSPHALSAGQYWSQHSLLVAKSSYHQSKLEKSVELLSRALVIQHVTLNPCRIQPCWDT